MTEVALTCRHFGRCGGCTALPVPIATQLASKRAHAQALLRPYLGDLEIAVDLPPRAPSLDRMKLLYPARPDAQGELQTGLYVAGTHDLLPIEECQVQAHALTALAKRVTTLLRAHGVSAYDERTHLGCVRALHARIAPGTGELLVGLVTHTAELPHAAALTAEIVALCADLPRATRVPLRLVGLVHNVNGAAGNVLLGPITHPLWGRDHLVDRADGLTFRISFASFYQVHRHAAAVLYRPALRMLGDVTGQRAVDGYGGVGTFALRLAKAGAARVDLVEANPTACADARAAAITNALADKICVHEVPFADADLEPGADVAIVDPPRAGLLPQGVARLLQLDAARVLYVSCSAESLARDMAALTLTYRVHAARLCDLFPHTDHSELLVLLVRDPGWS